MNATSGPPESASHEPDGPRRMAMLALGALDIVYGDIGISPLYALRECFTGEHGIDPSHENVLGVLSLIFWALFIIISVKYLIFVMRADNRGEGGILALMALVMHRPKGSREPRQGRPLLWMLGLEHRKNRSPLGRSGREQSGR
ncbi:hypothetical protein DAT35_57490 [Vitiosangium sp. GDMCC 1.1324]|nr:hypothetical protein DAT35_57490 [Vitiosangium sp. GDMCC 1.1324]